MCFLACIILVAFSVPLQIETYFTFVVSGRHMEPWSFGSEGKGFLFADEMDIPIDAFAKSTKAFLEWDNKTCFNFDKESVESMEFMDSGFPDTMKEPFHGNQVVDILSGVGCNDSSNNTVASPTCLMTSSSSWGDGESGSKFSSPVCESSSQDSSLIALKLGRLADSKYGKDSQHLKERSKRARTKGSYYQTITCQVHGCNMDLSSSKEYHKRHRVCDAHSKTAIVIVNGIEQRFCQQCSRLVLLFLSLYICYAFALILILYQLCLIIKR